MIRYVCFKRHLSEYIPQTKVLAEMIGKFAGGAFVLLLTVQLAQAQTCLQPIPPFVPKNPADIREYSDILRRDMEAYFTDVEQYFRCQDTQRAQVFDEARLAGEAYALVLDIPQGKAE
ncbi:MAG: hypothetical protein L3J30_14885 [Marinosulfonomonas sp.]|nr:hypothetical protein [Marinosulfonomonas sp.]